MNLPLVVNVLVFAVLLLLLAQTRHKQWSLAKKVLIGLALGVLFGSGLQWVYGADNPYWKSLSLGLILLATAMCNSCK